MGREAPSFLPHTDTRERPIDATPQCSKGIVRLEPRPENPGRTPRRKVTNTGYPNLEGFKRDRMEGLADVLEDVTFDLADEAQGQMKRLGFGPTRSRYIPVERGDAGADFLARIDRHEESNHRLVYRRPQALSWRLDSSGRAARRKSRIMR